MWRQGQGGEGSRERGAAGTSRAGRLRGKHTSASKLLGAAQSSILRPCTAWKKHRLGQPKTGRQCRLQGSSDMASVQLQATAWDGLGQAAQGLFYTHLLDLAPADEPPVLVHAAGQRNLLALLGAHRAGQLQLGQVMLDLHAGGVGMQRDGAGCKVRPA